MGQDASAAPIEPADAGVVCGGLFHGVHGGDGRVRVPGWLLLHPNQLLRVRHDAAAAPDETMEERLERLRSPFRAAEAFRPEEIIDPRDTRPLLCEFAELSAPRRNPGRRRRGFRP